MEFSNIFIISLLVTSTFLLNFATPTISEQVFDVEKNDFNLKIPKNKVDGSFSLREMSQFLAKNRRGFKTCDEYPRVCDTKGSGGPDCCRKKCVDVMIDKANCGKCGRRCKYSEMCCQGKCVNPFRDEKHCGGCNKMCNEGSSCLHGMCSYA